MRFVVDNLNSYHTDDDVEVILQELPIGMEELYSRMAAKVVGNPSPRDRSLAATILRCITCCMRILTVSELSQALVEDTSRILDLQRSILDLCGGFVVIDNGGHASIIHETAREFLLTDRMKLLSIDAEAAHEQIFLTCLRSLTAVGLRAKINRKEKVAFLDYAAT